MVDKDILTNKERLEDKEKRIKAEIAKYNKIFKDIEPERKKAVDKLIGNVAFMAVTLEDLQEEINQKGCTETYQNGAEQHGIKEATEVKVYNSLIRNYNTSIKQLLDQLPANAKAPPDDGFGDFIKNK